MLTVRAARADDLGAIVKLERYCFPPEVAFGRSRWHYLLNQAKGRTLLLQDEKAQVMGYLSVLEHKGWDRLIIQTLAIRWTVRRQGWAMINEELEMWLLSLAVSIRDRAGRVVAAINVSSQPHRQKIRRFPAGNKPGHSQ